MALQRKERKLNNRRDYDSTLSTNEQFGSLISTLFHCRTLLHFIHLQTRSLAQHLALEEFYEVIPEKADLIAELYQGATGEILEYPAEQVTPITSINATIEYLDSVYEYTTKVQKECMYSDISNELDEVKALINKLKYKLKFLN